MEVFDDILNKTKLDRNDLQLIIEKIRAYEDTSRSVSRQVSKAFCIMARFQRKPADGFEYLSRSCG